MIRCHKLKELDLSDATSITDNSVEAIYKNLKDVEVLSLSRCYNIAPASYTLVMILLNQMQINFHFTDIFDAILQKIIHAAFYQAFEHFRVISRF